MSSLQDVRCVNCGTLVAKASIKEGTVSLKCRKCGQVTMIVVDKKPESQNSYTDRLGLRIK
jgi:phage FluMu protein Com